MKRSILIAVVLSLICVGAYTGIPIYLRNTERAEIVEQLNAKSEELAKEIGGIGATKFAGHGAAAKLLQQQEDELRAKLAAFDEATERTRNVD